MLSVDADASMLEETRGEYQTTPRPATRIKEPAAYLVGGGGGHGAVEGVGEDGEEGVQVLVRRGAAVLFTYVREWCGVWGGEWGPHCSLWMHPVKSLRGVVSGHTCAHKVDMYACIFIYT